MYRASGVKLVLCGHGQRSISRTFYANNVARRGSCEDPGRLGSPAVPITQAGACQSRRVTSLETPALMFTIRSSAAPAAQNLSGASAARATLIFLVFYHVDTANARLPTQTVTVADIRGFTGPPASRPSRPSHRRPGTTSQNFRGSLLTGCTP